MTITDFNNRVVEIIGNSLDLQDFSEITPDSRLQEELGMNSLAILVAVSQLEDEFDVRIPSRALTKIVTVGDLQEYILKKLI